MASHVAAIGGRVDANRTGGHLTDSHDVCKLGRGNPVGHYLRLNERQHAVASSETKQTNLEEGDKQLYV